MTSQPFDRKAVMPLFSLPVILPGATPYSHLGLRPEATPEAAPARPGETDSDASAQVTPEPHLPAPENAPVHTPHDPAHTADAPAHTAYEESPPPRTGHPEIPSALDARAQSTSARPAHDAQHPPLSLTRLQPTWSPVFDNRTAGLAALRTELEHFLSGQGEDVAPPTDLTRTDFTGDYTPCALLDDTEDAWD